MTSDELKTKVFDSFESLVSKGFAQNATLKSVAVGAYNTATQSYAKTPTNVSVFVLFYNTLSGSKMVKDFFPEINLQSDYFVMISTNGNEANKQDKLVVGSDTYFFVNGPKEITLNSKALYVATISDKQVHNG